MTFNPKDFFEFSKELFKTNFPFEDAKIRTILSRVYYAVHLFAREKLNLPEKAHHDEVYKEIKNRNRIIGKELDYLWIYRVGADYRLDTPCEVMGWRGVKKVVYCDLNEAKECIERGEKAIQEIERSFL